MTTSPLCVSADDIACSLNVCGSTWRSFCTLSKPLALPYENIPGAHKKPIRAYHLQPVIDWLRAATPERMNATVECKLYAKAQANQTHINKTSEAYK